MTDDASEKAVGRLAIGIDVGGSGIKAAVVDVDTGRLISERLRVPTPVPSTPELIIASISRLVRRRRVRRRDAQPFREQLAGIDVDDRGLDAAPADIDPDRQAAHCGLLLRHRRDLRSS